VICIKKLVDEDFKLDSIQFNNPRIRFGARGIVFNEKSDVAILYKKRKNEYKLIGGGIEENEDPMLAFKREAFEETGCKIEIDRFIGVIEEHKSLDNFKQISYVYISHVIENTGKQHFTSKEKGEGAELLWLNIHNAIELIKNSENNIIGSKYDGDMSVYHTKFIVRRDYEILKYYLELSEKI